MIPIIIYRMGRNMMKTAVFYGEKDIRVEERELIDMGENELIVKVARSGICGSELHEYAHGPSNFLQADVVDPNTGKLSPYNTGHEFGGVVERVGANVKDVKIGDRVTVNPMLLNASSPASHAEYVVIPEKSVYKLPESLTLEEGALVEPAATAVQAIKKAELNTGDSIVVFGVGPIGLLTIVAAKASGATNIIGVDLSDSRLKKAKDTGATHIINSGNNDPIEAIKEILPEGADITFEVAGVEPTFKQSIQATRAGGKVVIVSVFMNEISWNPFELSVKDVTLMSTLAYTPDTFKQTIDLIASGQLDINNVITDRIRLEDIVEKGFEALIHDKSQSKILVDLA